MTESFNVIPLPDRLKLPYAVPNELHPEHVNAMFPHITPEQVNTLIENGYTAFGVVALVVGPDNRILALRHKGSSNVPDGALGFISETAKGTKSADGKRARAVEQIPETISRAFIEEMGFDPEKILGFNFSTNEKGSYCLVPWPVKDSFALGFVVLLHADQLTADMLNAKLTELRQGEGTEEIKSGDFFNWMDAGRNNYEWRNAPLILTAAQKLSRNTTPQHAIKLPDYISPYGDDMKFS